MYPGEVKIDLKYSLVKKTKEVVSLDLKVPEELQLVMDYKAEILQKGVFASNESYEVCPINLTNHTYWNLEGHDQG